MLNDETSLLNKSIKTCSKKRKIPKAKLFLHASAVSQNFSRASFYSNGLLLLWLHNLCWYECCLNKQAPETPQHVIRRVHRWWNCDYVYCTSYTLKLSWCTRMSTDSQCVLCSVFFFLLCFPFEHHQHFTSLRKFVVEKIYIFVCFSRATEFSFFTSSFFLHKPTLTHMEACGKIILTGRNCGRGKKRRNNNEGKFMAQYSAVNTIKYLKIDYSL